MKELIQMTPFISCLGYALIYSLDKPLEDRAKLDRSQTH